MGHQTDCSRIGNLSTDCWISIRRGSRDGAVVWEGLLAEGATARATGRRLWLRLGAPWNLDARLDGRPLRGLPEDTGNVVVTRRGLGPA